MSEHNLTPGQNDLTPRQNNLTPRQNKSNSNQINYELIHQQNNHMMQQQNNTNTHLGILHKYNINSAEQCIDKINVFKAIIQDGIDSDCDQDERIQFQQCKQQVRKLQQAYDEQFTIKKKQIKFSSIQQLNCQIQKVKQQLNRSEDQLICIQYKSRLQQLKKIKKMMENSIRQKIREQLQNECKDLGISLDNIQESKSKLQKNLKKKKALQKQDERVAALQKKLQQVQKIQQRLKKIQNKSQDQQQQSQKVKVTIQSDKKVQSKKQNSMLQHHTLSSLTPQPKHSQLLPFKNQRSPQFKPNQPQKLYLTPDHIVNKYQRPKKKFKLIKDRIQQYYFQQGTPLSQIKSKLKIRNSRYYFFANFKLYQEDSIQTDLQFNYCCIPLIKLRKDIYDNDPLPTKVPIYEVTQYLSFQLPKNAVIAEVLMTKLGSTRQVSSVKPDPNQTLQNISKNHNISEVILAYEIKTRIQILINQKFITEEMSFQSNICFYDLKCIFQQKCKKTPEQQKWIIGQSQLKNDQTFEDLQITNQFCRIEVQQIQNLQFYGFTSLQQINQQLFRQFYIQDDAYFIQTINQSNFPQASFEKTFRVLALRIIFSAVKKHCRVSSAITQIKRLIKQTKKNCPLWLPKSSHDKIFFNEGYALNNILTSAKRQLIVDFMRINKYHSPLPIVTQSNSHQKICFENSHFWICNKATTIISMGFINQVYGKTTFLNRIFHTQFDIADQRHPICSKSVYIKYDIYRNQKYPVNLVDISNNSLNPQEKARYCRSGNLILLHYVSQKQYHTIKDFLKLYSISTPIILIKRDASETKYQYIQKILHVSLQKLTQGNLRHYENIIDQISDEINDIVVKISEDPLVDKWKLCQSFIKQNSLEKYFNIMKNLQKNFSTIIPFNSQNKIEAKYHPLLVQILEIDQEYERNLLMSKIKDFARVQRQKNMLPFQNIIKIETLLQKKSSEHLARVSETILKEIQKILQLQSDTMTKALFDHLTAMQTNIIRKNYSKENFNTEILKQQFDKIRNRQFSIQNFWRNLSTLFDKNNLQDSQKDLISSTKDLFNNEFQSGQCFEVINGDSLQMPIRLLKSNCDNFRQKKIKTIGIFGPQSSGKSTLLNFLFGCDFMSSDGRCTNGVYGTYYDVAGRNIFNCEGILILDTEGLFGNFKRNINQGKNFDNKLVLFLIKVCDIMVFNTRGDIDVKSENILQLSFDSELIDEQQTKYPNFYIVLNHGNVGQINHQQLNQIHQMMNKIYSVCPKMQNFMSTQQATSLPNAFITLKNNENLQVLCKYQKQDKTPTRQFYLKTKKLALDIMNILEKQGRNLKFQQKNLQQVYEGMDNNWTTILSLPLLTRYTSRMMKKFDLQVRSWKKTTNQKIEQTIDNWKKQSPNKLLQLVKWEEINQRQYKKFQSQIINEFDRKFIKNEDPERNNSIDFLRMQIEKNLDYFYKNMRLQIISRRYKLDIEQSKNRGVNNINQKARDLKRKLYVNNQIISKQTIDQQFQKQWKIYTQSIFSKIDRLKSGINLSQNITQRFNLELTHQKKGQSIENEVKNHQQVLMSFEAYADKKKTDILQGKDFHLLQINNREPVILTKNSGPTQLTRQYLDMSQFFEFGSDKFKLSLNIKKFQGVINKNLMSIQIQNKMSEDVIINEFVNIQESQLKQLGVQLNKQALIKGIVEALYKTLNNWMMSQKINQKSVEIKANQNTMKYKQLIKINKFYKCEFVIPQYLSRSIAYSINYEDKINQELKYQNHKYPVIKCIQTGIKQVLMEICSNFISQEYSDFKDRLQFYEKNYLKRCYKELEQIGIYINQVRKPKQMKAIYFSQKPIQVKSKQHLFRIIDTKMPQRINCENLKKNITGKIQNNIVIAHHSQKKIQVKKDYKKVQILNKYMNKQFSYLKSGIKDKDFRQFILNFIQKDKIFDSIKKFIIKFQNQPSLQLENATFECIRFVSAQLDKFNKDLQQICHQLTYQFNNIVYQYTNQLLWKFFQQKEWVHQQKTIKELDKQKHNQKSIFEGIISKSLNQSCLAQSRNLVHQYKQFLQKVNKKQKSDALQQAKTKFLSIYTRQRLQQHLDKTMQITYQVPLIFEYLSDPKTATQKMHEKFVNEYFDTTSKFFKSEIIGCINEFTEIVKNLRKFYQNQENKWDADDLFDNKEIDPYMSLKQIFQKLIMKGEPLTSKDFPNFQIKQGVQFRAGGKIIQKNNINFFNNWGINYSIPNYIVFLKNLQKQLQKQKIKLSAKVGFSKNQKLKFEQMVKIKICNAQCPCCGRLCDIDLRQVGPHTQHKCQAGHQMRAIKGIRIQKKQKDQAVLLASVMRCQDIKDSSVFLFNGKQWNWRIYKQSKKKQWNFQGNSDPIKNQLFKHMWQVAGKKICKWRQAKDKQKMEYVEYTKQTLEYLQQQAIQQEKHYIFAIDDSYSMLGQQWLKQKQALKNILNQLSQSQNNYVSIVAFNNRYRIIIQNKQASKIDIQTVQFQGGSTSFVEALKGSIVCFKKDVGIKNIQFILISDGQAPMPELQIQQIKKLRQQNIKKNFELMVNTIHIGKTDDSILKKIAQKLHGESKWINNCSQLTSTFKQIMKSAYN